MIGEKPYREMLFAMVWKKPATLVAKDMGIWDVALGKLCWNLQVPKPLRGYRARIAAGQTPTNPPIWAWQQEIAQQLRYVKHRQPHLP